jgi:hypothetical protein
MRVRYYLIAIIILALPAVTGCGKRQTTAAPPPIPAECVLEPGPSRFADTVTVAVFDPVDPAAAPRPRNPSECLVFRHCYETLITIDCTGEIGPGLAESWTSRDNGRLWTFILRDGARFWDGSPVRAADVAASWRFADSDPAVQSAGIDHVTSAGERVVHVYFTDRHRGVPRALATPVFAVAKESMASRWPIGSGPYGYIASERGRGGVYRHVIRVFPAFGAQGPVVQFVESLRPDARDLLDGQMDVMVTADPDVIEYAAVLSQYSTITLSWDKTYVLLSPSRVMALQQGRSPGSITAEYTEQLARDAVRCDSRGFQPPVFWEDMFPCGDLSANFSWFPPVPKGLHAASGARRILFDRGDPVASDLANRIVALAGTDPARSREAAAVVRAVPDLGNDAEGILSEGVTEKELAASLRDGDDFAYIIPIRRWPIDPCFEARTLINRARWLSTFDVALEEALLPLVDTRRHLIIDSGKTGVVVDYFGNVIVINELIRPKE